MIDFDAGALGNGSDRNHDHDYMMGDETVPVQDIGPVYGESIGSSSFIEVYEDALTGLAASAFSGKRLPSEPVCLQYGPEVGAADSLPADAGKGTTVRGTTDVPPAGFCPYKIWP